MRQRELVKSVLYAAFYGSTGATESWFRSFYPMSAEDHQQITSTLLSMVEAAGRENPDHFIVASRFLADHWEGEKLKATSISYAKETPSRTAYLVYDGCARWLKKLATASTRQPPVVYDLSAMGLPTDHQEAISVLEASLKDDSCFECFSWKDTPEGYNFWEKAAFERKGDRFKKAVSKIIKSLGGKEVVMDAGKWDNSAYVPVYDKLRDERVEVTLAELGLVGRRERDITAPAPLEEAFE